jgi:carbamoyltransferase
MITWGINALNHGSSLAVFQGSQLIKYSTGSSVELDDGIVYDSLKYGGPSTIYWYERPWLKKIRQLYAGQWSTAKDMSVIPKRYLCKIGLHYSKLKYTPHHASHAAAGYYTSPFDQCAVVVLDAIGEFECASIWLGQNNNLTKVWGRNYPNSLGLFYSAFTKLLGYRPILDEGRITELSKQGDPHKYYHDISKYFQGVVSLKENFHRGVVSWPHGIKSQQDRADIAASVQKIFEDQVDMVMVTARTLTKSDNLVYMGGCAMNTKYNQRLHNQWKEIWSLPQPGDNSSAIGAVLYHTKKKIDWNHGIAKHLTNNV